MDTAKAIQAVRDLILAIGDDPDRPGLQATPERVIRAWRDDWGSSYLTDRNALGFNLFEPADEISDNHSLVKMYGDTAKVALAITFHPDYNQMVVVRDLTFVSHCEHHMAPFFGEVNIAYVPTRRGLLGLSKFARVVDYFSKRLQMQERMTNEIAGLLQEHLSPHIGVMVRAKHMCMISRGVRQSRSYTVTSALRGDFYEDAKTRSEFFQACRSNQSDPG